MASGEVERLRAEVRRARANATRKATRLRRDKGVRIERDPKFDPRRGVGVENSYNARQLRAYLRDLQGFNSRNTQFVAGAAGAPIRAETARRLVDAQGRYNRSRAYLARNIQDVEIPGTGGRTFGDELRERGRIGRDQSPLSPASWDLSQVEGEQAAQTLTRTLRRRATPQGQRADVRRARTNLVNMAKFSGDGGALADRFMTMTDDQILAFWSTPNAVTALALTVDSERGAYDTLDDSVLTDDDIENTDHVWDQITRATANTGPDMTPRRRR